MSKIKWVFFCCFLFAKALYGFSEKEIESRIYAHFLLEDFYAAMEEAKQGLECFPDSKNLTFAYIRALTAIGDENTAFLLLKKNQNKIVSDNPIDRSFLEEIAWSILQKGASSSQQSVRLTSLIGAYMTQDAKAIKIFLMMLKDPNPILRSIAVQFSCQYQDACLKKEIVRLFEEEEVFSVKLEVLKALGCMKIQEKEEALKKIASSEKSGFEEQALAIEALVSFSDRPTKEEIIQLAKSPKAGLRMLACELASHWKVLEVEEAILSLLTDTRPEVRIEALNTYGLVYRNEKSFQKWKPFLEKTREDADGSVAITSCWVWALLGEPSFLEKWLYHEKAENRRLAAKALVTTGPIGVEIAQKGLQKSKDPYVQVNLALGLIGQRVDVDRSCDALYRFIKGKKELIMEDGEKNGLFRVISPSRVHHIDQIPHYPEAIDHITQLHMISILAMMHDPRASEMLKEFLQNKTWGITGFAAATLLQESDEDAIEILKPLLSDKNAQVRVQAALVLALYGKDPSAISVLEGAYQMAGYEMKARILEALGYVASIQTLPFFINSVQEPFIVLRLIGASSLIQCLNH